MKFNIHAKKYNRPFLFTGLFFVFAFPYSNLFAQADSTVQETKLKTDEDVITIIEYKPTISDAFKIREFPQYKEVSFTAPEVKYNFLNKNVKTTFEVEPISSAVMKGEPLNKLYNSYIKGGLGNYTTGYGEAYIGSNRSRDYMWNARLMHLSSQGGIKDVGYNGFSNNKINLNGKKFLSHHLLSGAADYSRDVIHYYGYDSEFFPVFTRDNTRQRFSNIGGNVGLKSFHKDSTDLNYEMLLKYYNLSDLYKATENNVLLDASFQKYYNRELMRLNFSFDYNNLRNLVDTNNNAIVKINPQIISKGEKWRLDAGLGIYVDADDAARFHFYPDAHFRYNVAGNFLIPYMGITGKMKRNSLATLSAENPFINSAVLLQNSNHKLELYGGLRGSFNSNLTYNAQLSFSKISAMPLFVNDTLILAQRKFNVIYDDIDVTNIAAEAGYQKNEKIKFLLKGNYFIYSTLREERAWHLPDYKVSAGIVYDLGDKLVFKSDIYYISRQFAKTNEVQEGQSPQNGFYQKELKGVIDINIGAEYRYSERLSAFLNLNNIANQRYYRWNNYPNQRFNLLAGLTWAF